MHSETVINAINASPMNRGLDGTAWVSDPDNIAVVSDAGVVLFEHLWGASVYEVHFLLSARGRTAIDAIKAAFSNMFDRPHVDTLCGLIPNDRRDSKLVARWAGAKSVGLRQTDDGPCELFILSRSMWKVN